MPGLFPLMIPDVNMIPHTYQAVLKQYVAAIWVVLITAIPPQVAMSVIMVIFHPAIAPDMR